MRVQYLTSYNGPEGMRSVGDIFDVPANEAKALIEGGNAIAVAEPKTKRTKKTDTEE